MSSISLCVEFAGVFGYSFVEDEGFGAVGDGLEVCSCVGIMHSVSATWLFRLRWLFLAWLYSIGLLFPIGIVLLSTFKFLMEDGVLGARVVYSLAQLAQLQGWTFELVLTSTLVVLGTKGALVRVQLNKFGVSLF